MSHEYETAPKPLTTMNGRLEKAVSKNEAASKSIVFGKLTVGDCVEEAGATLIFETDGRAGWSCVTFTNHTHSGDIWHATFVIKDEFNVKLFQLPTVSGPKMNDDGTKYHWERVFTYDANLFDRLSFVDYTFSC